MLRRIDGGRASRVQVTQRVVVGMLAVLLVLQQLFVGGELRGTDALVKGVSVVGMLEDVVVLERRRGVLVGRAVRRERRLLQTRKVVHAQSGGLFHYDWRHFFFAGHYQIRLRVEVKIGD